MAYIISAFPGCGKTYCTQKYNNKTGSIKISDSDSSMFSWILDEHGKSTGVRNPDFPENYISHIKKLVEDRYDIIFVSTHQEVRDALEKANLKYILVYPEIESKEIFLDYYKRRNSPEQFIELMNSKWDIFIGTCEQTQPSDSVYKKVIKDHSGFEELIYKMLYCECDLA